MVDEEQVWRGRNEGTLARSWEDRIKPKAKPTARRRRLAQWVPIVGWISVLWIGGMASTILAVHVITMSYQYDQLNQQYAALVRQNQSLSASVATMTSAQAFMQDAARLKVTLVAPKIVSERFSIRTATATAKPLSPVPRITSWIARLAHTLGQ
jgi:cell division protein FtsB